MVGFGFGVGVGFFVCKKAEQWSAGVVCQAHSVDQGAQLHLVEVFSSVCEEL
jgi:hypothetical protein